MLGLCKIMSEQEVFDSKLKALGLTVYEIKTFKALVEGKTLTADEIHQLTEIPTPRIYDTIDSLEKKGLVEVITGRPKRFKAVDIESGMKNFLTHKKKEFEVEFESIEETTLEILAYLSQLTIKPDELLEAYSSLKEMENKTLEIINSASNNIAIFTNVFYWFDKVSETLVRAIHRGVDVRVIMTTIDEKAEKIAKDLLKLGVKVKHIQEEGVLVRGTLVDRGQVVFVIWVSPKTGEKYIYRPHFSSNSGIIELFSNNFEYLWNKGKDFI